MALSAYSTLLFSYYAQRYGINIKDMEQPLIKSRSTERRVRAGEYEVIALIPELCRPTGLTEDMRNNFRLMRTVAEYTRIGPAQRVRRLTDFNRRLHSTPDSINVLNQWNMQLDRELVTLNARELEPEEIVFGPNASRGTIEADWTRAMRNNKLHTVVQLDNWFLVAPMSVRRESNDFIRILQESVRGMGMRIASPKM